MAAKPTIAVIVPLLNEARNLPVLLQQFDQLGADELLLVDGGSDDHSVELLSESGLRWITSKPGRAKQMNAGSKLCKSDILLFIHADTVISSSALLSLKSMMRDSEYVGGRFDLSLSGARFSFRVIEWFINRRSRLTGISTGDQCQFVRRSVFEHLGRFPELSLMEDVALSRLLKREGKVACLSDRVITSSRRWQQHGMMKTVLLMWKIRFLFWLGMPAEKLSLMYRDAR